IADTVNKILTIQFDSTANNGMGCLCRDGIYRQGTIRVQGYGRWGDVGSVLVVTLENYYVFHTQIKFQVNGARWIKIASPNTFEISTGATANASGSTGFATIQYINAFNNAVSKWKNNGVLVKTKGVSTPVWIFDDAYSLTGSAEGINRNGVPYTVNIVSPIITDFEKCTIASTGAGPIAGKWKLTNTSNNDFFDVNYDPLNNQACDRLFRVTYKNKDYDFYF
ncbi:MAG: hypothetical protein NZ108_09830, partial [Bacteroidia bacterium]|nr:hypothetical protein [Bacteroidia bacterium]